MRVGECYLHPRKKEMKLGESSDNQTRNRIRTAYSAKENWVFSKTEGMVWNGSPSRYCDPTAQVSFGPSCRVIAWWFGTGHQNGNKDSSEGGLIFNPPPNMI